MNRDSKGAIGTGPVLDVLEASVEVKAFVIQSACRRGTDGNKGGKHLSGQRIARCGALR